jgi:hypothetical protein
MLQSFKNIWYKSWTKFLAYVQGAFAAILAGLGQLHNYISDPTLKTYVDQIDLPKYVIAGLATLGILTWLAHGRENDA